MSGRLDSDLNQLAWKLQYARQFLFGACRKPEYELHRLQQLDNQTWASEWWHDGVPVTITMGGSMIQYPNKTIDDVNMELFHA